jgi:hypothetical protein
VVSQQCATMFAKNSIALILIFTDGAEFFVNFQVAFSIKSDPGFWVCMEILPLICQNFQ